MLYHDFQGLSLSALGLGAMHLPVLEGEDSKVNQPAVEEMVDYAIGHGVNYFDTAWGYPQRKLGTRFGQSTEPVPPGPVLSGGQIPRL